MALYIRKKKLSPLRACLSYPLSLSGIDALVIGVDNMIQLNELLDAIGKGITSEDFSFMTTDSEELINPSKWRKF